MSAVPLIKVLNDSTISTSQNHEGVKKNKKHKHKATSDDHPADVSVHTTTVDGMLSEEKRKRKKKKRDKPSENNDFITEPSQSGTIEMQSKQQKSKGKDKHQNEAEIVQNQEPESTSAIEEKRKEKKKKRDTSSEKIDSVIGPSQSNSVEKKRKRHKSQIEKETQPIAAEIEPEQSKDSGIEPSQSNSVEKKRKRHKSQIEEETQPIAAEIEPEQQSKDSGIEPSQSNAVEKKRKRHKSQVEEETQPIAAEVEPEQSKDSMMEELTQESRRKRRKTNPVEEVPKEAEKGPEVEASSFNGMEEGEKITLRRSRRKSVAENAEMSEQDQKTLLSRMLDILPKPDVYSYVTRLEEFDWDSVKFNDFSVKYCQEQFQRILAKIRKSRTLAEVIHDAQNPGYVVNKKRTRIRTKSTAKRTAFQLYLKKKVDAYLQKHPGKSKREDATEKYRSKWAALSDEEKVKYIRKAEEHNTKFQEEVEEKCRNNPLFIPPKRLTKLSKGDQKILDKVDGIPSKPPSSGYMLFCETIKERLKTEMPDISNTEFIVEMGRRWSSLSEKKKEHYKRKTEKIKHKYLEFLEANPEIEAKVNADKQNRIIVRKTVKRIFDGEPAKPPGSGYMMLCKEILPTLKNMPSRLRMLEASIRWAKLTEMEKTEYNEKMKAAMQSYLTELEAFKEKLSPEDLQAYEQIHKKISPPSPSKVVAGKRKNPPSDANKETVRKRKRTSSKKAKSKSPIPNSKPMTNNGGAGGDNDKIDKGNISDSTSEVF